MNFKHKNKGWIKIYKYSEGDYILCMTSHYLYRSFTNVTLLCFDSHSNDMTSWQSSSAGNVSCNVMLFFYHHSVVIQRLVSDTLYQIGDFLKFQRKTYIMLDKWFYLYILGTICCPVDCGTACKLPVKPPGSGKFIYISWVLSVVLLIVVQPVNCQLSLQVQVSLFIYLGYHLLSCWLWYSL
jgi:hypothetical protein